MLIIDGNTRKLILKDLQVNTFNDEKGNFVAHCGKYLDVPFFITRNLVIFADKFYPKSYTINDKKYTIFFNAPDKPFFVKLVEFHCTDEKNFSPCPSFPRQVYFIQERFKLQN